MAGKCNRKKSCPVIFVVKLASPKALTRILPHTSLSTACKCLVHPGNLLNSCSLIGSHHNLHPLKVMFAGGVAGMFYWMIIPIDILKTRCQIGEVITSSVYRYSSIVQYSQPLLVFGMYVCHKQLVFSAVELCKCQNFKKGISQS